MKGEHNARMKSVRSRTYLDGSRDQPCVRCGRNDGTVVPAHYCGIYQSRLGKGTGIKASDLCVADLCHRCHADFDGYKHGNDSERAAEFLVLIIETQHRRWERGLLTVRGARG